MVIDNTMVMISAAIAFIALFLLSTGVSSLIGQMSARRKMIDKIRAGGYSSQEEDLEEKLKTGSGSIALNFFRKLGTGVTGSSLSDYSSVRLRFLRAGIHWDNPGAVYWGAKLFFIFVFPATFIMLRLTFLQLANSQLELGIGVVLAVFGFYLPDLWLHIKADRRKQAILKSLPDSLDLLVVCVESGMSMDSAFNRVAKEIAFSDPELSRELSFLNLELRAGKMRRDALRNLALRTNLDEVSNFATLLIQADKFGTSVAQALRVYSDSFRTQRFQRAEEIAAKMPVKILIPLALFIFPALFVVLLGPAAISIYRNILLK